MNSTAPSSTPGSVSLTNVKKLQGSVPTSTLNANSEDEGSHARTATSKIDPVPTSEENLMDFDGPDDPYRPLNWPMRKKIVTTLLYSSCTMGSTWASTAYIILAVISAFIFLFIDESFPPVLLARKANKVRLKTRNWAIHSKSQEMDQSLCSMAQKYLIVLLEMLVDPTCFFINLYASFGYAIIYLAITAFPIEFIRVRRWNELVGSLPFLATLIGVVFAACIIIWAHGYYRRRLVANNMKVVPEARLLPMMVGSFFFTAGLFIMGWTSKEGIPWIAFCIGASYTGLGFFTIFQSALNYLVDTYLMLAASALAANMLMRSVLAATFPLYSNAMFTNLGLDWGFTLLGFLSAAMIPISFLFFYLWEEDSSKRKTI